MQPQNRSNCRWAAFFLAAIGLACSPSAPPPDLEEDTSARDAAAVELAANPPERVPDSKIEYARFDGNVISKEMFDKEVNFLKKQRQAQVFMVQQTTGKKAVPPPLTAEQRKTILRAMLDRRIVVVLAERDGISVAEEEVDAIINRDQKTDQNYRDYLNWHQITEPQLRVRLREQEMGERFAMAHSSQCAVTPEQLLAEYERLKSEGKMDGKAGVDFWQILVKAEVGAGEPAWEAARAKIEAIRARIAAGEDFSTVATEASEDPNAAKNGGLQQGIPKGMMPPEMEKALFEIPLGETSAPIRVSYGWHLIKVKERREEGTRSFEHVADTLRESMISKCRSQALAKILEQARKDLHAELLVNPGPE